MKRYCVDIDNIDDINSKAVDQRGASRYRIDIDSNTVDQTVTWRYRNDIESMSTKYRFLIIEMYVRYQHKIYPVLDITRRKSLVGQM